MIFLKHKMDSTLSGQVRDGERRKRVCTHSEDERLVESLTEIMVLRKIKCDNGFKPRTFLQVEKLLEEKLLNSGLKASPYMESHVMTLKRQFNVIIDMLTHGSKFLWDNEKKTILCDQDIFEGWIKVNIFTILPIYYFPFLFFIFLCFFIPQHDWYIILLSIYYVFSMSKYHLYLYQLYEWCLLLLFTNFS